MEPYFARQMQKRANAAEREWKKGDGKFARKQIAKAKSSPAKPLSSKSRYTAYFDGCCEPINPGGTAGFGAVVFDGQERIWECSKVFIPVKGRERETSNNVAEYAAFNAILDFLIERGATGDPITIYGDSKLVIEQCFGKWRVKAGFYVPLAKEAKEKVKLFKNLHGQWIPREENSIADELSKNEVKRAGVKFRIQPESDQ